MLRKGLHIWTYGVPERLRGKHRIRIPCAEFTICFNSGTRGAARIFAVTQSTSSVGTTFWIGPDGLRVTENLLVPGTFATIHRAPPRRRSPRSANACDPAWEFGRACRPALPIRASNHLPHVQKGRK